MVIEGKLEQKERTGEYAQVNSQLHLYRFTSTCTYLRVDSQLLLRRDKPSHHPNSSSTTRTFAWQFVIHTRDSLSSSTYFQPSTTNKTTKQSATHFTQVKRSSSMWATQPRHRCPNNSTTSTEWRISFLLICTRLHEFQQVPYIIINLPRKRTSYNSIRLNNVLT